MRQYKMTVRKCVYNYATIVVQSNATTDCDLYEDAFLALDDLNDDSFYEDDEETVILSMDVIT